MSDVKSFFVDHLHCDAQRRRIFYIKISQCKIFWNGSRIHGMYLFGRAFIQVSCQIVERKMIIMKIWYCITEIFNDDNTINKAITDVIEADERPESTHECISDKTGYKEVYKDWFAYHGTATVEELRAEIALVNAQQRVKYIGQECGSDVYLLTDDGTENTWTLDELLALIDEDIAFYEENAITPAEYNMDDVCDTGWHTAHGSDQGKVYALKKLKEKLRKMNYGEM